MNQTNVFGEAIEECCSNPLTGYFMSLLWAWGRGSGVVIQARGYTNSMTFVAKRIKAG